MKLIAFCEAAADFRVLSALVDRVLREAGPAWIADVLDATPEAVREWLDDGDGHAHWDVHHYKKYIERFEVRPPHGHFDSQPGAAASVMARTVFAIVRRISRKHQVDGVVLLFDMDRQPDDRRRGLAQARIEALAWADFAIVVGRPNAEREAWVLVGFDPETNSERARLDEVTTELGFCPVHGAHRLDASHDTDKKSPKRVLRLLIGDDFDREARCWTQTPLTTLRARSADTDLAAFLDEVEQELLPRLLKSRR